LEVSKLSFSTVSKRAIQSKVKTPRISNVLTAFDASDLPSGTYLYRLETPQGSFVRTMLLAK